MITIIITTFLLVYCFNNIEVNKNAKQAVNMVAFIAAVAYLGFLLLTHNY